MEKTETLKIGLIVNPIAGMGGRVGLKGTDGAALAAAVERGAVPRAESRAAECLREIVPHKEQFVLYTGIGRMGELAAREAGFEPLVIDSEASGAGPVDGTSAEDTESIARKMLAEGVGLILFAGGDGTARDVYRSVGEDTLVLGIPAGVKIHSAVFASSPRQAGMIVSDFVANARARRTEKLAEVMDIDEEAYRNGVLKARLYGYLRIPYERARVQGLKSGTPPTDAEAQSAIAESAAEIVEQEPGTLFLIGAGTTTRALMKALGLDGTLLGVDAAMGGALIAADLGEKEILDLLEAHPGAKIVITPIGGQGVIFGRGNQQFSPEVIRKVGRDNIMLLASPAKLNALEGAPLLIDTGDAELDRQLEVYYKIVSGYRQFFVYKARQG